MAEDFTTYTEVDEGNDITVIASRVSFDTMACKDVDSYVYKDKDPGHFDGDFEHLTTLYVDQGSAWGIFVLWGLANLVGEFKGIDDGGGDFLGLQWQGNGSNDRLRLLECVAGTLYNDPYSTSEDTAYYTKIKRVEAEGVHGTFYCYVYSDANRTNLLDTLSLTLHEKEDFRYIYALSSWIGVGSEPVTGYVENFDLQEIISLVLSDTIAIADSPVKAIGLVEADALTLADSLTTKEIGVNKADSIAIADSLARVVDFVRAYNDSVAIAESLAKEVGIAQADDVTIADVLTTKAIGLNKSDNVAIADNITRVVAFIRALADSVAIADAAAKEIGMPLADSMAIADSIATVRQFNLAFSDTVAIADAVVKAYNFNQSDSVAIAETIVKAIGLVKVESFTLTDAGAVKAIGLFRAETVLITDIVVKSMAVAEADSVVIADSIAKTIGIVETEAFALADTITKEIGVSLAEAVAIVDVFSRTVEYKRAFADTIAILDSALIPGQILPGLQVVAFLFRRAIIAKLHNREIIVILRNRDINAMLDNRDVTAKLYNRNITAVSRREQ